NGVVEQTRRHAAVAALLRVPHVVLAVNKMDLVDWSEKEFLRITEDFARYAAELDHPIGAFTAIPVSALTGDNVVDRSAHMDWYTGPTLLDHLETVRTDDAEADRPARLPVQYVIRHGDDRFYAGQLATGELRTGDAVVVLPSGVTSTVTAVERLGEPVDAAYALDSVSVRLADDLDIGRGDLIAPPAEAPALTRSIDADVCHLHDRPLRVGDRVLLRHTTRTVKAIVQDLPGRPDSILTGNELGRIRLRTAEPLAADAYAASRRTGSFLLIDPADGATLTAGMVR
ncbi:GTP-binding protein, partial [Streptomyces sp. NPDC060184]|uniref:elongation factor 1-alpha C-terminal domain-related protein n=1 Tax=Streptomyces sp. NPDC060184 TaxID=3347064 RepID=UPI00366A5404